MMLLNPANLNLKGHANELSGKFQILRIKIHLKSNYISISQNASKLSNPIPVPDVVMDFKTFK